MSLDQNLFTLSLTQNKDNPNVVDLVDPSGTVHYRKLRLPGTEYKIEVYDPLSQSLLITAMSPIVTSKVKTLELCNPTLLVELKYTGTLSFRWSFKWEEHDFEWKREECFMLRKPDPPVLVAVTKEPAGRLKTTSVQILDYNLNRFDIDDRKGLEIVILTALLTFQDVNEGYHTPQDGSPSSTPGISKKVSTPSIPTLVTLSPPPQPPPRPVPKTGVDRIAEVQAMRGEYNEITVEDEGTVNDYAEYCSRLLEDDAMLFVTVRSATAEQVPKVLQIVEQTKRIRHKAGLSVESELHQYVLYDNKQKGPKRIVLDDNQPKTKYTPPNSLTIHLSKIDMPELQPKTSVNDKNSKDKPVEDLKKKGKEEKKAPPTIPPSASRPPNKLNKPSRSTSPKPHVHQAHSKQLSSSNPGIQPPPIPYTSRPQNPGSSQPFSFPTPQTWDRPGHSPSHAGVSSGLYMAPTNTGPFPPRSPYNTPHDTSIPPGQSTHSPSQIRPPNTPTPLVVQKPIAGVSGIFDSLRRR